MSDLWQKLLEGEVQPVVEGVGANDSLVLGVQYHATASMVLLVLKIIPFNDLESALILISLSLLEHKFMVLVLQIS